MDLISKILQDTYTVSTLGKRLRALRSYLLHGLFTAADQNRDSFKNVDISVEDLQWIYTLGTPFFDRFNKDNVYIELDKLTEQASKLPALTIYLSFEPDEDTERKIGQFLRDQFRSVMIYDVKIDANLIAGAALVWKGVYKDYSVKNLVEQKRDQILLNFKTYLKK